MIFPLRMNHDHYFLELDGGLWLMDTGAPQSFGCKPSLELAGESFDIQENYMGLVRRQMM